MWMYVYMYTCINICIYVYIHIWYPPRDQAIFIDVQIFSPTVHPPVPHLWMSHGTHADESRHKCKWIMAHMYMSCGTPANESRQWSCWVTTVVVCEWVTTVVVQMSHDSRENESRQCEWVTTVVVLSHDSGRVRMSHDSGRANESRQSRQWSCEWVTTVAKISNDSADESRQSRQWSCEWVTTVATTVVTHSRLVVRMSHEWVTTVVANESQKWSCCSVVVKTRVRPTDMRYMGPIWVTNKHESRTNMSHELTLVVLDTRVNALRWTSHATHMNASRHTHQCVLQSVSTSHLTQMNRLCHMYESVTCHTHHVRQPQCQSTHRNKSCHTYYWVKSHTRRRHVTSAKYGSPSAKNTHMNESCHTYTWVISHTCISSHIPSTAIPTQKHTHQELFCLAYAAWPPLPPLPTQLSPLPPPPPTRYRATTLLLPPGCQWITIY